MSERTHYVVIGNGPAGNSAADVLRAGAPDARVTIISDEPFLHYHRCRLPEYITGQLERKQLFLRPARYYRELDIKLRLGQRVVDLDTDAGVLTLDHKEYVHYDGIVLAMGSKPKIPEPVLESAPHIRTLQTLCDADDWKRDLAGTDHVVLIGGDLVSVRFAQGLAGMGMKVSMALWEDSFWPLEFNEELKEKVIKALEAKGIRVLNGGRFQGCEPCGVNRYSCTFSGGTELECGLVGGFFGYSPEVAVLGRTGLQLAKGILADEHLKTDSDNVYVAGDLAQVYSPEIKNYWVSIGWDNAKKLGAIAASNLLGGHEEARSTKESILEVEGVKIETPWWTEDQ